MYGFVDQHREHPAAGGNAETLTLTLFQDIPAATRASISRVSSIIRTLAMRNVPLTDALILEAYELSLTHAPAVGDLLKPEFGEILVGCLGGR